MAIQENQSLKNMTKQRNDFKTKGDAHRLDAAQEDQKKQFQILL